MNKSIHRISLDVHDTGSQVSISVKKGDTARSLYITLQENGKPYHISNACSAVFTAIKPDGNYLFNMCNIKDNIISYNFTEQTVPIPGKVLCEITLYDTNKERITSPRFDIVVDDTVYNGEQIVSSNEADSLISVTDEARAVTEEVKRKLANGDFVGPKGDKGDTGEKGDKGKDGIDAIASMVINDSGELVITYSDGTTDNVGTVVGQDGKDGAKGEPGSDYVLTEADKLEIANLILADSTDILEVGQKTPEGGEVFNLYKDTKIESQTIPKNKANEYAHAEGVGTSAEGKGSHCEGVGTSACAEASHAEGVGIKFTVEVTKIDNDVITVESKNSSLILRPSELESIKVNSIIWYETDSANHSGEFYYVKRAELVQTLGITTANKLTLNRTPNFSANANITVIMGAALSPMSHTEGSFCNALNVESTNLYDNTNSDVQHQHAEGSRTLAVGYASHTEGVETRASGRGAHAEGQSTNAFGDNSHTEGHGTSASGSQAHAEGENTVSSGEVSHAEGQKTQATGNYAHAEGNRTIASGTDSHSEGSQSKATGDKSHAEGNTCTASGLGSHAEGKGTQALKDYAHSEGYETKANGRYSHAEGYKTQTTTDNTHASGECTIATTKNQFVIGQFNKINPNALLIVGNGSSEESRSNAFEVLKDGSILAAGIINLIYPIGSVCVVAGNAFNPNDVFGGVWNIIHTDYANTVVSFALDYWRRFE